MDNSADQAAWEAVKKKSRFHHALRGLYVFWKTTRNLPIHTSIAALVIIACYYFQISLMEWIAIVFAIGLVVITEGLNTAIEIDIDLTSPQYHPYARDTKDVAAGAVLISVLVALVVGVLIFLPKILDKWALNML